MSSYEKELKAIKAEVAAATEAAAQAAEEAERVRVAKMVVQLRTLVEPSLYRLKNDISDLQLDSDQLQRLIIALIEDIETGEGFRVETGWSSDSPFDYYKDELAVSYINLNEDWAISVTCDSDGFLWAYLTEVFYLCETPGEEMDIVLNSLKEI